MPVASQVRGRPNRFNEIAVIQFSSERFVSAVAHASGALDPAGANQLLSVDTPAPANQTLHVAELLDDLDARTLVIESHYVDRHFIEEHALYYSRCLVQPRNVCVRIHAFSRSFDDRELQRWLGKAARGKKGYDEVQAELTGLYLGFVVVRPLPSVPIGRTVLQKRKGDPELHTQMDYRVHLLGLELRITGLAFQQQDRAVGACATTAIWVALQRLVRWDGGRAPTPAAVTQAAVRHFLPEGRPFPSAGLATEQVSEALRCFDFGPEVFGGAPADLCRLLLGIYLRSGIPVILGVEVPGGEQHAIAALGCRRSQRPRSHLEMQTWNDAFNEVIFHDDRIGPYVSAELISRKKGLELKIRRTGTPPERLRVLMAFAPMYPKIRTSAAQLVTRAFDFGPLVASLLGISLRTLQVEMLFERSGTYQQSLFESGLSPSRVARFQRTVALSRYVGVIRWSLAGQPVLDTLWDTTDKMRDTMLAEQLLGVVARTRDSARKADELAALLGTAAG